jgi:hypothetical protein
LGWATLAASGRRSPRRIRDEGISGAYVAGARLNNYLGVTPTEVGVHLAAGIGDQRGRSGACL